MRKTASADATQEYRGPIIEVVTDCTAELIPDDRPDRSDARPFPLNSQSGSKVSIESTAPIALDAKRVRPSSQPPSPPPKKRSADASLEFPHPVSPELFEDTTGTVPLPPDFENDDDLPPRREAPRWRYLAFTGVMVVAGILFGLAIGSRGRTTQTTEAATVTKPIERKPVDTPTPAATTAVTTGAIAAKPADPTTGTINSPKWAKGRRVYVDGGKDLGPAGEVEIACGTHIVQIGAKGKPRKVNVPCGGSVSVLP